MRMPKVIHTDSKVSQTDFKVCFKGTQTNSITDFTTDFNRKLHIIYKEDKDTSTDVDVDEERGVDDDNEMNKFWKVFF